MILLGIDFGLAKIGLAISEGELANTLPILHVKDKEESKRKLLSLITTLGVKLIIFGVPNPDSIGAAAFAKELEVTSGVKMVLVDETMTTNIAKQKSTKKKSAEDSIVAAILLQEYLDRPEGEKIAL